MSILSSPASTSRSAGTSRFFAPGVYIALFFIIAVATFSITQYSSDEAATTAQNNRRINLASRQAALVQRVTASLLSYERDLRAGVTGTSSHATLQAAMDEFHATLRAFASGGQVTGTDGKTTFLAQAVDAEEARLVRDAMENWLPLQERLNQALQSDTPVAAVSGTVDYCLSRSDTLFNLSTALAARTEVSAGRTSSDGLLAPRNTFIAVDSIAIFLLPGFFMWRRVQRLRADAERSLKDLREVHGQLEAQTQAMSSAKTETDSIMDTVQEGLLLISDDGTIGHHYSRELSSILRQEDLAGMNLLNLLQRLLSDKMYNVTRDYFGLLFDIRRKEKAVLKVNPLLDIEVNFPNPKGGFDNRYLCFNFRRIVQDGKVTRVFVAVRDVTAQIELERKLRESEKNKERQLEILLGIMRVDATELESFSQLVEKELGTINETLRAEDFAVAGGQRNDKLRERLNTVFRSVHNVKGNAVYLGLDYFQKGAEAFESKISELLDRPVLSGDDFLAIVVAQAGLRADLVDLNELRLKLAGLRQNSASSGATAGFEVSALANGVRKMVKDVSTSLSKEVDLEIDTYALNTVSVGRQDLVRDVIIQLARNALAHSIEGGHARELACKPRKGKLSVRGLPRTADGMVGLAFRDDGRGLDIPKIRARAEATGLLSAGDTHNPAEIARCIFEPGFSTAAQADAHSGRGMGMDIIKSKVVDELGGAIEVRSAPGSYCEFQIYLPEVVETATASR